MEEDMASRSHPYTDAPSAPREAKSSGGEVELLQQAWGALNFILAFYEPGQRYLDTEAWKVAEATGRRVHAALRAKLDALAERSEGQ